MAKRESLVERKKREDKELQDKIQKNNQEKFKILERLRYENITKSLDTLVRCFTIELEYATHWKQREKLKESLDICTKELKFYVRKYNQLQNQENGQETI